MQVEQQVEVEEEREEEEDMRGGKVKIIRQNLIVNHFFKQIRISIFLP